MKWTTYHKDNKYITFHLGSRLFHLEQPCTYSRSEDLYEKERMENERDGTTWPPDEYYEIDISRYLKEVLAKAWLRSFEAWLKSRDKKLNFSLKMTDTVSPKEYNFATDAVEFDLTLAKTDLKRIYDDVMQYRDLFDKYLLEANSSRPGFWSHMPDSVEEVEEKFGQRKDKEAFARAVVCLLEFWMFAISEWPVGHVHHAEPSLDELKEGLFIFSELFYREIENLEVNGALHQCFNVLKKGTEEYDTYMKYYVSPPT